MCQTGSALTSDVDDRARAIDTLLREGVLINDQRCHLDPSWVSPLDERDVTATTVTGAGGFGGKETQALLQATSCRRRRVLGGHTIYFGT